MWGKNKRDTFKNVFSFCWMKLNDKLTMISWLNETEGTPRQHSPAAPGGFLRPDGKYNPSMCWGLPQGLLTESRRPSQLFINGCWTSSADSYHLTVHEAASLTINLIHKLGQTKAKRRIQLFWNLTDSLQSDSVTCWAETRLIISPPSVHWSFSFTVRQQQQKATTNDGESLKSPWNEN